MNTFCIEFMDPEINYGKYSIDFTDLDNRGNGTIIASYIVGENRFNFCRNMVKNKTGLYSEKCCFPVSKKFWDEMQANVTIQII